MQRFRIPTLIGLMVVAGIIGAAIYDWGKPVALEIQQKVTEAVMGKQPYDRFTDPAVIERRAREREQRRREEELRRLQSQLNDRIDCLERKRDLGYGFCSR